jgi:phage terminase large subunit
MKKEKVQLVAEYTKRQAIASNALDKPEVRRLLYGGAKGGGKSWFLVIWSFLYAWNMCVKYKIKPSNNPPHIGWLGRKQATDFTSTTLQTWRQTIPEGYYELKGGTEKDPKHILIMNRIAIDYGGLDRQEQINKFNSAEYAFFAIDQAEETDRNDVAVLKGSLRLTMNGEKLPYKELYTANPRICWLKDEFINSPKPESIFVPALPSDNPYLPDDYEKTLIDAFGYRPELIAAYLHGDWSQLENEAQIILDSWLARAMTAPSILGGKIISCDVARFGDDKTHIMVLRGSEIEYEHEMGYSRTTEVSNYLTELSRNNGNCPIAVDEIGIGGGVIDELYKCGRRVISFNSASKADNPDKFYNKRAEAWWEAAEHFSKSEIGCRRMSTELRKQLCIPTYEFRNGKIIIEPKEKIKERLGYSPDCADCYIIGLWAVKRMMPDIQFEYSSKNNPSVWSDNVLTRGFKLRKGA